MSKKKTNSKPSLIKKLPLSQEAVFMGILMVLFFLLTCLSTPDNAKNTGVVMMLLALVILLARYATMRDRMGYITLILIFITAMGGISTFYAGSGKYALAAFLGLAIALSAALVLLALPDKTVPAARRIAVVLSGCAALVGFFSIDLIATRWFSTPLLNYLGRFSDLFFYMDGVEPGVRITSIFGNANIFAGVVGIGVLLSLSLALTSEKRTERVFHLSCLYINSVAFVLAFSMGAIGAIVGAFAVYLLLEHPERRGGLFVLMVETLALVAASSAVISAVALDEWNGVQGIPLICLVLGAAVLCLADRYVGLRLTTLLGGRGRLLGGIIAGVLVCAGVFAVAACCWTGGTTLEAGESLRRSVYPQPGAYTISAEGADAVSVTVTAQNQQDAMMHTDEVLYEGAVNGAAFTVPEDAIVVWLNFSADRTAALQSVQLTGGETVSVPLDYVLLPDFIANRIQGFFANQNVIQRFVFFGDGLELFRRSPVIGLGLGAFENSLFSVQSFIYRTKFVHNHYIQTLMETGVIGLILFLGLLGVSAVAIFRARRRTKFHPMTPALGALLVFMAVDAAVEVVFSSVYYLPMAFGVFVLMELCCGKEVPLPKLGGKVRSSMRFGTAAFLLVFAVLVGMNIFAAKYVEEAPSYRSYERAISVDVFEWEYHAATYLYNSTGDDVPADARMKAEAYAERLEKSDAAFVDYSLTYYYLELGQMEKAMESALEYVEENLSESGVWNSLFTLLSDYESEDAVYREGVAALQARLERWNAENLGEIELTDESLAFLERVTAKT